MQTEQLDPYGGRLWPEMNGTADVSHQGPRAPRRPKHLLIPLLVVGMSVVSTIVLAASRTEPQHEQGPVAPEDSDHPEVQAPPEATASRVVEVYAALILHLNQKHWEQIYVSRRICTQFPFGEPGTCVGTLTYEERASIVQALPSLNLTFKEPPQGILWEPENAYTNRLGLIELGPLVSDENAVRVEAGYGCGVTCGYGTTYVLRRRSGGWRVTDQVGEYWIS